MPNLQSQTALSALSPGPAAFEWVNGCTPIALTGMCLGLAETLLPSLQTAQDQFARFRGIAVTKALDAGFLLMLQNLCDTGTFLSDAAGPGHREVEAPQRAGRALNLVLSRPAVLRWLEEVTSAGPLREISGRVVQTFPRPGDELRWHDDRPEGSEEDNRQLAIVINLGEQPFAGGEFELRHKRGELLLQHQHTAPGSLLIFRVSDRLEHRVLPLTAGGPRRVFTGWAMGSRVA